MDDEIKINVSRKVMQMANLGKEVLEMIPPEHGVKLKHLALVMENLVCFLKDVYGDCKCDCEKCCTRRQGLN